jgi:anaerobic selenocysteine-containing dehydrogenase
VFLNPGDAKSDGVADGDFVRVSSRRGTIELRARLSHRDTPGPASSRSTSARRPRTC